MFTNVNVDCCKTPGCKNLGLLNSQDYVAQGKNILCNYHTTRSPVSIDD